MDKANTFAQGANKKLEEDKVMQEAFVEAVALEDLAEKNDNPRVFFDIYIGGEEAGRITIELFAKVTPRTVENFRALCTGEKGIGAAGKPLWYKGAGFHTFDLNSVICGGDIIGNKGHVGESIYGGLFATENFIKKHTEIGLVSMGKYDMDVDYSGSSFYFHLKKDAFWDNRLVVIGKVVAGLKVVLDMNDAGNDGLPGGSKEVIIFDCGQIVDKEE